MSVFRNVSGDDRELQLDGRRLPVVAAGDTVSIADEFDSQLIGQSGVWEFSKKKSAPAESVPVTADEGDN